MMTKPRCDPIDIQATLNVLAERACELVGARRDPATLRQLYANYASVAARPYARASWEKALRAAQSKPDPKTMRETSQKLGSRSQMNSSLMTDWPMGEERWAYAPPVKPATVLTLLSDAPMLYVRGIALSVETMTSP